MTSLTANAKENLLENGALISDLYQTITFGGASIKNIPGLVKRIIKEHRWNCWLNPYNAEVYELSDFRQFVEEKPHKGGLGTDVPTLKKLCEHDNEALALIDELTKRKPGGDKRSEDYHFNVHNMNNEPRPWGTSRQAGLRRLQKEVDQAKGDRKDLIKAIQGQVLANEMSVNAAMVELGIRQKTITVTLDVEKAASTLKRHFEPDQIAQLINLLQS